MLNANLGFPYPILTSGGESEADYKKSRFQCNLEIKDVAESSAQLDYQFDLNNNDIQELIDNGSASFAIEIRCTQTIIRNTYRAGTKDGHIELDLRDYFGDVRFFPIVIVTKDVQQFTSADLHDEFESRSFSFRAGDIIAAGEVLIKHVDFEQRKLLGYITSKLDEKLDPYLWEVDITSSFLAVRLGKKVHQMWNTKDPSSNIRPALCTAILKDLIFFALQHMTLDDEDINYRWANALKLKLREMGEPEPDKDSDLQHLNNLAQKLIKEVGICRLGKFLGV